MRVWKVETAVGRFVADTFVEALMLREVLRVKYGWARLTHEAVTA